MLQSVAARKWGIGTQKPRGQMKTRQPEPEILAVEFVGRGSRTGSFAVPADRMDRKAFAGVPQLQPVHNDRTGCMAVGFVNLGSALPARREGLKVTVVTAAVAGEPEAIQEPAWALTPAAGTRQEGPVEEQEEELP